MLQRQVTITSEHGLHARPAAEFVRVAETFKCSVHVARPGEDWVNGKSVLGLLTLAAEKGQGLFIRIDAHGDPDLEHRAFEALSAILQNREQP